MYRRLKKTAIFYHNKPVTKHGGGKIERRVRIAMYIAIGIGLAGAIIILLYFSIVGVILYDLFQVLLKATIIPLVIVTFYIIGLLDADSDIYKEKDIDETDFNNKKE